MSLANADSFPPEADRETVSFASSPRIPIEVPECGDVIDGKYRIERLIGAGGMGVVMSATHLELGELVAIKFLAARADTVSATRFRREARLAVRLKSEHIVHLMDVGTLPSGAPYLVMEQLSGGSAADLLAERGPFAIADAIDILLQAMVALAEAHRHGIVHRDIKPSNLFVTTRADGSRLVKVIDFGIAKLLEETPRRPGEATLTRATVVLGSPGYMAPEQIRNARDVDVRADIWSLGVVLHELVSGRLPFDAETHAGLMAAVVADPPKRLREHCAQAPRELEEIILRCLEKDRDKRFRDVAELADALAPFAAAERTTARPRRFALLAFGVVVMATAAWRMTPSERAASAQAMPPLVEDEIIPAQATAPAMPVPSATTSTSAPPRAPHAPRPALPAPSATAAPSAYDVDAATATRH
ncbi:MAG TPA: serine/threonine-protein kinase [Polyangiaceae bacterium]|nr:serine/threonine-protein kinase [Polyangiaceae bacterium]